MGEIIVQRDDQNRILNLSCVGLEEGTVVATTSLYFLHAAVASMNEYLHVAPDFSVGDEIDLNLKRSDFHLNREIDAIMETLVIGLKMLSKEYPDDLVVNEATIGIQV